MRINFLYLDCACFTVQTLFIDGRYRKGKVHIRKGTTVQSGWSCCAKHRRAYFLVVNGSISIKHTIAVPYEHEEN